MKKNNFWNRDILKPVKSWVSKKINSYSDWFNNIWSTLFPTGTDVTATTQTNRITHSRGSQATVDLTFPDTVNYDLAMQLYYNTKAGYKLGAFFCSSIIDLPLTFMGIPHFDCEDWDIVNNPEWWQERFDFYNKKLMMDKQDIQKLCHITGTVGIFPWFDSKTGYVKLYFIKSKYITDIFVDPDRQELTGIKTEIMYTFVWDDGKEYRFTEKKTYTKSKIMTTRTGALPGKLRNTEIRRNPTGTLPVFFANNKEKGMFEGHSDFEKVISLIKAYSEVNLRAHQEAANMKAKLLQTIKDKDAWLEANGYTDVDEISIENKDFVLNVAEEEKTEILVPQNLIDNHLKLLKLDFWNIAETSKIPEIFWGKEASGNYASAGKQDKYGLAFIKKKQQNIDNPYLELLDGIVRLDAMAYNRQPIESKNLLCSWNDFDSVTEVEKAEIFDKWCTGLQKLADIHAIDLEGIHQILLGLTNNKITDKFDEFKKQIEEYGTTRAFLEQEYMSMRDLQGNDDDAGNNGNGNGKGENEELIQEIEKAINDGRIKAL